MPLKLIQTVAPATDVVTDAEQKDHAKISLTDDDTIVATMNEAAIEFVQDRLQRGFVTQTWELSLDNFPTSGCPIELCRVPAIAITSISYIDTNGDAQTLASTEYTLDDKAEPAQIHEAYLKTWPSTQNVVNAVTILYTVGYGTAASATPEKYKMLIKHIFTNFYEHREPTTQGKYEDMPMHLKALFEKYEMKVFG